jgi:hypothetical protein
MTSRNDTPEVLSIKTLLEILAEPDWCINGGPGEDPFPSPIKIDGVYSIGDGELFLKVPVHEGGGHGWNVRGFAAYLVKPHLLHITRIFEQKQDRSKARGGGKHMVPSEGVWWKLYNPRIEREEREKAQLALQQAEEQRAARAQKFVERLDVVGRKLTAITFGENGKVFMHFGENVGLVLSGELFSLGRTDEKELFSAKLIGYIDL